MHAGESARAGSLLLHSRRAGGLAQDSALGHKDDMAIRELLLELASKPATHLVTQHIFPIQSPSPLLNLVESLELGNGHKDNDGFLATLDINLPGGGNLKNAKL